MIVGEPKTPDALRNACDQFFEWDRTAKEATMSEAQGSDLPAVKQEVTKEEAPRAEAKPLPKRRPRFLVEAVTLLTGDTSEGKVGLGALGQYLKRTDPSFSPNLYGHSGLLNMVKTYDLLTTQREETGGWSVSISHKPELPDTA